MQTLLLHSKERMISAISRKTVHKTNGACGHQELLYTIRKNKDTVLRRLFMTSISIIGRKNHALTQNENSQYKSGLLLLQLLLSEGSNTSIGVFPLV